MSSVTDGPDPALAGLIHSIRETRDRIREARRGLEAAGRRLADADRRVDAVASATADIPGLDARLDRLEAAFAPGRLASHVAAAVERTAVIAAPAPHALITDVLPADAYAALVANLPPRSCFDDPGTLRLEMPMPPALAPVESVIVWRLMTELARDVLGPAVVRRFGSIAESHLEALTQPADAGRRRPRLSASQGRLLLRLPGFEGSRRRPNRWHLFTVALAMAAPGSDRDFGSTVGSPDDPAAVRVPFVANSALAVVDDEGAHEYQPIPSDAPVGTERCTYEFPIGPQKVGRGEMV
ncbi:MAG: hypothetical protein AB7P99_12650 [Vicinamibacterales bacterium]